MTLSELQMLEPGTKLKYADWNGEYVFQSVCEEPELYWETTAVNALNQFGMTVVLNSTHLEIIELEIA